jgi:hypothetical protein
MKSTDSLNRAADRLFLSVIHIVEGADRFDKPSHLLDVSILGVGIDLAERALVEESGRLRALGFACIARLKASLDLKRVPAFEVLDLIFILALVGATEEDRFDLEKIMAKVGLSRTWAGRLSAGFSSLYPVSDDGSFRASELMAVIERR